MTRPTSRPLLAVIIAIALAVFLVCCEKPKREYSIREIESLMHISLPASVIPKDIQFETDYYEGGLPDYFCLLKAYMNSADFMTFMSSSGFPVAEDGTEVQYILSGDYLAPAWWNPETLSKCMESRKTEPGQIWEVVHGIDSDAKPVCYMRFTDW